MKFPGKDTTTGEIPDMPENYGFDKLNHHRQAQPPSTSSTTIDKLNHRSISSTIGR